MASEGRRRDATPLVPQCTDIFDPREVRGRKKNLRRCGALSDSGSYLIHLIVIFH